MQQFNYDETILTFQCQRKHLIIDSKYYLYLLPKVILLSSNPKQQNPKYIIQLELISKIYWITKEKSTILEQFGFLYKDELKYFHAPHINLQELKDRIQGLIMQKDISDFYLPVSMRGRGGSSRVYLVTKKCTQQQFASKCVEKRYLQEEDGGFSALFNEIKMMQQLRHENIIQLVDLYEGENTFYLILEYLEGKSLHDLLSHRQTILEQDQIQTIIQSILTAVEYMHTKNIMHRDLKPENVMFKIPNDLISLKIVDFGLATHTEVEVYPFPKCGTPGYVAPEVANLKNLNSKYSPICDEFSIGCIFYKLLTGKELFIGNDYQEILKQNKKCQINLDCLAIYKTPPEAIDLISKLLKVNPQERITAQQALQHPYFQTKYQNKKSKFQQQSQSKVSPISQTQNFNSNTLDYINQKLEEYQVEDEHVSKLNIPVMQNIKSLGKISMSPQLNQPRKNMKKFQTSEFDQYLPISPKINNFKPSLILKCESILPSPNNDKTSQSTRNSLVKQNQGNNEINFMYQIEEEQDEEKGIQK